MNKTKLTVLALSMLISVIGIGLCVNWIYPKLIEVVSLWQTSTPNQTVPALPRVDAQVLKNLLDRDTNSGIEYIEQKWKQEYQEYLQTLLPSNQVFDAKQMSQILDQISNRSGKISALIYEASTENGLELILVAPNQPPIHKRVSAAKRQYLLKLINKFRSAIVNPNLSHDYLSPGKELYNYMIAPLEAELKKQKVSNLIFCLGAGLRSTPLAALHDGNQFLIEKYSLGIIPAFNLLDFKPTDIKQTQILAMGASQFQTAVPLPAVPIELSSIINNKWRGKSLLNQEFTPANLKKQRAIYPYGIVHLATHAELSPDSAGNSYIQFWNTKISLEQIKSLELDNPPVQLLVLSACRTALGNPQAELGFAGLAVESGAKATVASLWSVDDGGTLAWMTQFYQQLKATPIKAEALRQTQIAMIKQQVSLKNNPAIRGSSSLPASVAANLDSRELSHPYYWAGFMLIGNPW